MFFFIARLKLYRTREKRSYSPHASTILKSIGSALERSSKMAMNLMLLIATLINKRELEQSPHIGSFARQGNEQRNVRGVILRTLPVWVEVDSPRVTADGEGIGGDVFADPDAFGERVAADLEFVEAVDGFREGGRHSERFCRGFGDLTANPSCVHQRDGIVKSMMGRFEIERDLRL